MFPVLKILPSIFLKKPPAFRFGLFGKRRISTDRFRLEVYISDNLVHTEIKMAVGDKEFGFHTFSEGFQQKPTVRNFKKIGNVFCVFGSVVPVFPMAAGNEQERRVLNIDFKSSLLSQGFFLCIML